VFENRKLRIIFGTIGEEIAGEWRKLHNEESLICSLQLALFV
jgi:hypothetical protein